MTQILVVDDNAIDRQLATRVFRALPSCDVQFARSAEEALAAVASRDFDLVLTDMRMPGMTGLELLQEIRERHKDLPVVLMTAFGNECMAVDALRLGATNFVAKSEFVTELLPICQSILNLRSSRDDHDAILETGIAGQATFRIPSVRERASELARQLQGSAKRVLGCDSAVETRIGVALEEALLNAVIHGNLGISSELRERADNSFASLIQARQEQQPYCDRQVVVTFDWDDSSVRFTIEDEGDGFNVAALPDPADPENLLRVSGRGVLLMNTFMDEVSYNATGNRVTLVKLKDDGASGKRAEARRQRRLVGAEK